MTMYAWTNSGGDNKWSNANNWSPNGVPGANSSVSGDVARFVDLPGVDTMSVIVDQKNLFPFWTVQFESSNTKYIISGNEILPIGTEFISLGSSSNTISCPMSVSGDVTTSIFSGQINLKGPITSNVTNGYIYLARGTLNVSGAATKFCKNIIVPKGSLAKIIGCPSN